LSRKAGILAIRIVPAVKTNLRNRKGRQDRHLTTGGKVDILPALKFPEPLSGFDEFWSPSDRVR
jgi:hypothetical protein